MWDILEICKGDQKNTKEDKQKQLESYENGKRYYVGYTGDLQRRLEEHKRGQTKTTREL